MKKILLTLMLLLSAAALRAETVAAHYPGGAEAMAKYLAGAVKYPKHAADCGIEGIVEVTFKVLPDGTRKDARIVRAIDPDLEAEALRVVAAMPAWVPAKADDGAPVESTATVAVKFLLDDED